MKRIFTILSLAVLAVGLPASCAKDDVQGNTDDVILNVATWNVDGLPVCIPLGDGLMGRFVKALNVPDARVDDDYNLYFNEDGPGSEGSRSIGTSISGNGWDIFGLNEDFNYHKEIWSALDGYSRGTYLGGFFIKKSMYTSLLGKFLAKDPLFEIDGLEFGVNSKYCKIDREVMVPWNPDAVYGYLSNSCDELTRKGFRYYQVRVNKSGTEFPVDFIILHANAGTLAKDISAREKAYDQLVEFIKGIKTGNPLIMMGDWNTRYYRDKFKELFIDKLNSIDGITVRDAWVEYNNRGIYPRYGGTEDSGTKDSGTKDKSKEEELDKILFLNRKESPVELKLVSTGNIVTFTDNNGRQLSDHLPVEASFVIVKKELPEI